MNVPKIRYDNFTKEWEKVKLSSQASFLQGLTYTPNDVSNDGTIVLRSSNIQNSMVDYNDIVRVNIIIPEKLKIKENDILMCVRNGSKSLVGKTAWLSKNEEKCTWGAFMNIIRPKEKNKFVYYYLNSKYFYNHVWKDLGTATVNQITKQTLESCYLNIPSIEEQEKISNTLSLLDQKIKLQSKKIEDLKLFKKGLINHIIENIEIEKIPLKNILVEQNNKTSKNNEYEILSSTSKGIYLQKNYFNKQTASDNNVGYKILKKNQLVLSPQNLWMGNINVNTEYNIGIVSPSYKIFNISNNVNIDFFNYWIKSPKALFEYKISSEQGASIVRRNLNMDLFYEIIVDLPRGKLQNKVGKIIKLLNLNIQYNEFLLQKLSELKKGLMQNMFV